MSRTRRLIALGAALATLVLSPGAAGAAPFIHARSAVLTEASTGKVLFRLRADRRRQIASTTKMMTALVAVRRARLGRTLTAPFYPAGAGETLVGLRPGERMTVRDLLRGLLLPSGNDAAATLARGIGGSRARFVRWMNRRARRLRLRHTHYANPIGLDDIRNYSSAADLARLAIVLRRNRFLRHTVALRRAVLHSGDHRRVVFNRNALLRLGWVNGVKTGHTNRAGHCLVASARRHGMTLVSVVLGTASEAQRDAQTLALLRYGYADFRLVRVVRRGRVVARLPIDGRPAERMPVLAARGVRTVLRRGRHAHLVVRLPRSLAVPLRRHARVGTLIVRVGRRRLARVALVTAHALR